MPRAARAPSTPKGPKSPTKSQPTSSPQSSPGIQKLPQEWKDSLQPWKPQYEFMHPTGTDTVTKTDAKKKFKLDEDDLASLPCEIERRPPYRAVQLYDYDQLMELAKQKCAKLGRPLEVAGVIYHYHSGSSQTGGVSVVSLKNPPKLPAWQEHIVRPNPPPLKIHDYTSPPNAVTPDPAEITWAPSKISGPVSVEDACRLYYITPEDIRDLAKHSPWIDLPTVAKRAVALHGGFYGHMAMLRQRRDEEEAILTREIPQAYKRKSRFRFSPMILRQWEEPHDDDYLYDRPNTSPKHHVAVLYPIRYYCNDDYGSDWNWMPDWKDF